MLHSLSAGMPMPVSVTDTTTSLPCNSARRSMRPPLSVYLAALLSRFRNTCASRVRSASTITGPGGSVTVNSWPIFSMSGRLVSMATCTIVANSTGSRLSSTVLWLMRLMSIRSSISRVNVCACRSMIPVAHCNSGMSGLFMRRTSTAFNTGASGLRNS